MLNPLCTSASDLAVDCNEVGNIEPAVDVKPSPSNQVTDGVSLEGNSEGVRWKKTIEWAFPTPTPPTTSDSALDRTGTGVHRGQPFSCFTSFGLGCSGLSPIGFGWYPTSRAATCPYPLPFGPAPGSSSVNNQGSIAKPESSRKKNQESSGIDTSTLRSGLEDEGRDGPSSWTVAEVKEWLQHIGAEASALHIF